VNWALVARSMREEFTIWKRVMKTTTKFIILKVEVLHEDKADVVEVCEEIVVVNNEHEQGEIAKSQVVGVLDKMPTW
jgi:hypothetical protein